MKALEIREVCPDCGTNIGELYKPGCVLERCPFCGTQMLQDDCCYAYFGIDVDTIEEKYPEIFQNGLSTAMQKEYEAYLSQHRIRWDGVWPGVRECREYNLWCKMTRKGWQKCSADDPEATEDLNTLLLRGSWDRERKRFVLPDRRGKSRSHVCPFRRVVNVLRDRFLYRESDLFE